MRFPVNRHRVAAAEDPFPEPVGRAMIPGSMDPTLAPFDRRRLRQHRDRAVPEFREHDFLFKDVAKRLAERLADFTRRFERALDLGCHGGELGRAIMPSGKIDWLVQSDLSASMAQLAAQGGGPVLAADEEAIPFAPESFDLVMSNLSLHWVNDLPGSLLQIRHALKPDGLFLAAMFGAGTLVELRDALAEAESEIRGGARPRVAPLPELRDAAGLLQRAGFALPVADHEFITVTYADPLRLLADLRGMGEASTLVSGGALTRRSLIRAAEIYAQRHADPEGRVPASFRILFLAGWAPHESQQKALRPGSAKSRLADALEPDRLKSKRLET
jgi:NADH dehydrogenase [ubiquinone] 1 alpha subcomplex assembly factor 5